MDASPRIAGQPSVAALPPLGRVAAVLRDITEVLAREIAAPTDQAPHWDEFEWGIARAVAAMQGMSSILAARLQWRGPRDWQRFLEEQRQHVAGRHQRIAQLLASIDEKARAEGVALVALKGAALHARGVYQAGARPMADIDFLACDADTEVITRLLASCDYDLTLTTWRNLLFESRLRRVANAGDFGENRDNPVKIELHTRIRERLPVDETDITPFLFPRAAHSGINDYPSDASLMMHLLLHAAGNMRAHALRLIQLHDIALLAGRFGSADWEELLAARPNGRGLWWAVPPLLLTARYYPAAIPADVIGRIRKNCHWLLDRVASRQLLADVSWSNIAVHALPGIEWSRTPLEALRFAISRVWPNRNERVELKHFAAHHPGASQVPWYGISQGARILRWLFSTPPRVQTVLCIQAALAHHDPRALDSAADEPSSPSDFRLR